VSLYGSLLSLELNFHSACLKRENFFALLFSSAYAFLFAQPLSFDIDPKYPRGACRARALRRRVHHPLLTSVHRFLSLPVSSTYKSLFSQPVCFVIYTKPQGVCTPLPRQSRLASAGLPRQSLASAALPRQSLASAGLPRQSLASAGLPRQSLASAGLPRQSLASAALPRQSLASAGSASVPLSPLAKDRCGKGVFMNSKPVAPMPARLISYQDFRGNSLTRSYAACYPSCCIPACNNPRKERHPP
jgi:hypothetical protein